jgi:Fe2+ or Zn2+ uptake regulation protein
VISSTRSRLSAAATAALERFRREGHRGTPALRHILQQLTTGNRRHTTDELFASLPAALTECDQSTIHRRLTQLQRAGIIHALPAARALTFGLLHDGPHHHESCWRCGRTIDVPPPPSAAQPPAVWLSDVQTAVSSGVCSCTR